MPAMPWEITREMFLDEREAAGLVAFVRTAVDAAEPSDRPAARLDRFLIEGLLFSGLRSSEFCGLRLGDTSAGHGQSAFVVRGGGKERRMVVLPAEVNRLVRDYVREVRPLFLGDGVDPDDLRQPLVFNEHRQPFERTGLYRRVVRVLTAAGLGHRASVQLLRHTYGYLAYLRTGGNLLFVQRQLGHAHPMVTIVYARFVDEDYNRLADRVAMARTTRIPRTTRKEQPHG